MHSHHTRTCTLSLSLSVAGELGWKSLGSLVCTKEGDDEGGCCRKIFKFENETNKEREMAFDILELDERTAGYG